MVMQDGKKKKKNYTLHFIWNLLWVKKENFAVQTIKIFTNILKNVAELLHWGVNIICIEINMTQLSVLTLFSINI